MNKPPPNAWDMAILQCLDETGGFVTSHVARAAWSDRPMTNRIRSAWMRNSLLSLEKDGYVRKLDGLKPDAWVRTPEGTKLLDFSRDMSRHERVS